MKFKVGDRVKNKGTGEIYKIIKIDNSVAYLPYLIEDRIGNEFWVTGEDLRKIEYTYEDLKKSPIGTKITLEKIQDKQLVKTALNRIENDDYRFFIRDFEGLNTGNYGKIIKIEEPEYTTVYEAKVEILDEVEKRYLRGVIRPFRDKVKYIVLKSLCSNEAYILIKLENDVINLPVFEINTMYKNMEKYKEYTLEELGL